MYQWIIGIIISCCVTALFGVPFTACSSSSMKEYRYLLPNNAGIIYWDCEKSLCNVYLKNNHEKAVPILKNSTAPSIEQIDSNLVKLFFSCGSPCNYTLFYSTSSGLSPSFELVVATDIKRKIVVVAEKDSLIGYKIFQKTNKPLFKIKLNWAPAATIYSVITEAKIINGILYIKYLEGTNFKEKIASIKI